MTQHTPAVTSAAPAESAVQQSLRVLKLLADETRWRLLHELRLSDYQVGELVERLGLSQNLVSYHLGLLRQAGFVQVHRSDADGRALYYRLKLDALHGGFRQVAASLHGPDVVSHDEVPALPVVFLCSGNSARSQMAEGWLRHLSGGRVPVQSAGVNPRPIQPLVVQVMQEVQIDVSQQHAKGLDHLKPFEPPPLVITVCDAAREHIHSQTLHARASLHWSVPMPARMQLTGGSELMVFRALRDELRERVEGLLSLLPTLAAQMPPARSASYAPEPEHATQPPTCTEPC